MGLELSLDRLKACMSTSYCQHVYAQHTTCILNLTVVNCEVQALAKYAFGLGTLQMVLCTLAFTLFALPVGNGIGTQILVKIFHAPSNLAAIRTIDEAVVIGAALSLSSSAFVLQLLSENGELASKFGSATLGILLLQVNATLCTEQQHLVCVLMYYAVGMHMDSKTMTESQVPIMQCITLLHSSLACSVALQLQYNTL